MSTVMITIEGKKQLSSKLPQAIIDYLGEGDIEDDDYDEEINKDKTKSYTVRFEFDGGMIELWDVPIKYLEVL
jgi:hypothetical protein